MLRRDRSGGMITSDGNSDMGKECTYVRISRIPVKQRSQWANKKVSRREWILLLGRAMEEFVQECWSVEGGNGRF